MKGLMTYTLSCNNGMNFSSEKAVGRSREGSEESSNALSSAFLLASGVCRNETYVAADSETMSLINRSRSSAPFLTDESGSADSCI